MKGKEGNIISFKVLLNSSGIVMTELAGIPEEELSKVFKGEDLVLIKKLVTLSKQKLDPLHSYLEQELQALNHTTT
jgi:hypothetical protein